MLKVSDEGHDALLHQFATRFSVQIEVAPVGAILEAWA